MIDQVKMPVCPYTLLKPVFQVADHALQHMNSANAKLRPYSNLLFGLFSLNMVLALHNPAFLFGGPDKPVDQKAGIMRDGSVQFSWFYWKPFLANVNLLVLYGIRSFYNVDWWTDSVALAFLSLNAADRFIASFFGKHPWEMTLLGGISLPKFQLIPKDGNLFDTLRIPIAEWKYEIVLAVRRLAISNFVVKSLWEAYKRYMNKP